MINLRHLNFLGIIIFSLVLSTQSFADKKFEKDLKKISKDSGFVDNLRKIYPIENISDNNIIIKKVTERYSFMSKTRCSYYFYNFAYRPFLSNDVFILN